MLYILPTCKRGGSIVSSYVRYERAWHVVANSVNHRTLDSLRDLEHAEEAMRLILEGKGLLRTSISSLVYLPLSSVKAPSAMKSAELIVKDIEEYLQGPGISPGLAEQLDVQLRYGDHSIPGHVPEQG
ncbi:hypothetical protein H0H87_008313 [Tephrocybe sp. NHM501043]|nr:hypothetical protein H0H87_008313 [Tephrocybe sp. NHM501043]